MDTSLVRLFVAATLSLSTAAIGCGGGPDAQRPEGGPAAANSAGPTETSGAASSESGKAEPEAAGPTTTTTDLGNGGDLQGAKLSSSTETKVEGKTTHGPKKGKHPEPGRGVKDIQAIIAAHRDEARACYDAGQKKHPELEGDLDIKWVIDPEGNVDSPEVDSSKSTILDEEVGKCVIGVIKKLRFAKSEKGFESRVHYPFNFHPKMQKRGAQKR